MIYSAIYFSILVFLYRKGPVLQAVGGDIFLVVGGFDVWWSAIVECGVGLWWCVWQRHMIDKIFTRATVRVN